AYKQTKEIPIVFGSMGDPLASKTVKALDRSGTNVTGVSSLSAPLVVKRLEFLLEASPGVKRVAFALTPDDIPGKSSYNFILEAAEKLGVEVVPYWIDSERDVTETARAIKATDVDGIVLSSDSLTWAHLSDYIDQSVQEGLPFAVFHKDMVFAGGLVGYGPDYFGSGEQSAVLVDKILRGQRPTDLPIESPGKLILAVNLQTALAIGIILPSALLQRADIVINE
ncbi:ABC transporter substrate-binding protein, partial [Patescibacteria group bacterium]|nr:ABC transporter substrate-binding protein [Patescibacteria group bacterium]